MRTRTPQVRQLLSPLADWRLRQGPDCDLVGEITCVRVIKNISKYASERNYLPGNNFPTSLNPFPAALA